MKVFGALRKMREFEKLQLQFIGSLIDFDIIIEVGDAQEQGKTFTPKQLFLLNVGSTSTVRRRLAKLTRQGIIVRKKSAKDHRSDFLTISSSTLRQLEKYAVLLSGLTAAT